MDRRPCRSTSSRKQSIDLAFSRSSTNSFSSLKFPCSRTSYFYLSLSLSLERSSVPSTSSCQAATIVTRDPSLNKARQAFAKRSRLSVADKLQTKSKSSLAMTTKNSSRVLGAQGERMARIRNKWVRVPCSEPSSKRACLEEPSSTGMDGLAH